MMTSFLGRMTLFVQVFGLPVTRWLQQI